MTTLYYIHDPMCSWCWGYSPVWKALQESLPSTIKIQYVAGGLAPDSDVPMPLAQQAMIQNHWRTIENKLSTKFNYDFWQINTPRRSTYNSCRAVIAAHKQQCQIEMIDAIQHAYYLRALNPSDLEVLIDLAKEFVDQKKLSIDLDSFINDLGSRETENELQKQIILARQLTQQGFPSLVLQKEERYYSIPIDYLAYQTTLGTINALL